MALMPLPSAAFPGLIRQERATESGFDSSYGCKLADFGRHRHRQPEFLAKEAERVQPSNTGQIREISARGSDEIKRSFYQTPQPPITPDPAQRRTAFRLLLVMRHRQGRAGRFFRG